MKYQVFDKAKWHTDAKNAPTDIPHVNGGTHIAFFWRWCVEKGFYHKEIKDDFADEIQLAKSGNLDFREWFVNGMDGVLSTEVLNTKGNQFACAYYVSQKAKFAKAFGFYLQDYADWVSKNAGDEDFDNAYFYIENSEENYQAVKSMIDRRYAEFVQMKDK
jgi:hypothetical protein